MTKQKSFDDNARNKNNDILNEIKTPDGEAWAYPPKSCSSAAIGREGKGLSTASLSDPEEEEDDEQEEDTSPKSAGKE